MQPMRWPAEPRSIAPGHAHAPHTHTHTHTHTHRTRTRTRKTGSVECDGNINTLTRATPTFLQGLLAEDEWPCTKCTDSADSVYAKGRVATD